MVWQSFKMNGAAKSKETTHQAIHTSTYKHSTDGL